MHLLSCLVLALATCTYTLSVKVGSYKPTAFKAASPNAVTSNVLLLQRNVKPTIKGAYIRAVRSSQGNRTTGIANLTESNFGQEFSASIQVGTETFMASIDTGSSDTWLIGTGFQCFNLSTNAKGPESECYFGPTYTPASTFTQIPNENFNTSYGSGEFLTGILGREQVTLAGITVPDQEIGVVDFAAWEGDGVGSGLIGLAFPSLTQAFLGSDSSQDCYATEVHYNPIFTSMFRDGSVAPMFSMALTRGSWGGTLAIGGVPNVAHSGYFATSPLQVLTMDADRYSNLDNGSASSQFEFYAITIQGFQIAGTYYGQHVGTFTTDVFGPPDDPETEQVIVDSGTTLLYASDDVAEVVNMLFDPPAAYSEQDQVYFVECDATPPEFGVDIGGQVFFINPDDMIIDEGFGNCITGISGAGNSFGVLGDVFLKNVLAIFDVGASEMRFSARVNY